MQWPSVQDILRELDEAHNCELSSPVPKHMLGEVIEQEVEYLEATEVKKTVEVEQPDGGMKLPQAQISTLKLLRTQ